MKNGATFNELIENLRQYKRKYYLNRLVRGSLITIGLVSSVFLVISLAEYYGRFNSTGRLLFLVLLGSSILYTLTSWIIIPAIKLVNNHKALSDEDASRQIGDYFPEIKDKLINTIQLQKNSSEDNSLILAGIQQRSKELNMFTFSGAIRFSENRKYLRYVLPPIALIFTFLLFFPSLLSESTNRIIKYDRHFAPPAPFQFHILNKNLIGYKNQDLELLIELRGTEIPDQCYIVIRDQRHKLKSSGNGQYSYSFKNIQRNEDFYFEAAGFKSDSYQLLVKVKPDIRSFDVLLAYPSYLKKAQESIRNSGNLTIPEGTVITWNFEAVNADQLLLSFESDKGKSYEADSEGGIFRFKKSIRNDERYKVLINGPDKEQMEPIQYTIHVIKDQYPVISVEEFRDSVLMDNIQFGGSLSDDYGLSKLILQYSLKNSSSKLIKQGSKRIPLESLAASQTFYFPWSIDSIGIEAGQQLEYYIEVFDNDGINGAKGTKSKVFTWKMPSQDELQQELKTSSSSTSDQFQQVAEEAARLQREMQQLEEKIRTKKQLSWQDKKALEDMVKKHQDLEKQMQDLKKNLQDLQNKQNKFDPSSQELAEKMKQLEKLMNELLDDETKKRMEELEKMLQQNMSKEELEKALKKINNDDKYLKEELERNLEMFKQMQFDRELENQIQQLEELSKQQQELSQKTLEQALPKEELLKQQEELNKQFNEFNEGMKNLNELNEQLENKNPMENLEQQQQEIQQQMQNSSEQLQNNQSKKAGSSQKNASDQMKQLSQKMNEMKQGMQAQQAEENLQDLRQILDNLLHLSFEQEALMNELRKVHQSDPRYLALGQQQLKLRDDSKMIKDSLYALAKRVSQIEAFVTKEIMAINQYMDGSVQHIRDRRPDLATADQQYTMTSINNLALMLNEVLKQMQEQMASSQPKMSGAQCNKPKSGQGKPKPKPGNMGQMQQQLNQKIEQLKKSGLSGKSLSEELAKLAAEQEALRRAMQEMENMMQEQGGGSGGDMKRLKELMEQTERDLVNKNITNETIMRQREILTRLLEAEKSVRERDWDDTRESKTALQKPNEYPPSLEKYLKAKQRQMELIKTVPPSYTPYYKEEIDEYFKTL